MRSTVVRVMLGLMLVSSSSFGEDDENVLEEAHSDIKKATEKVAGEAGVKGDIVHGAKYGSAGCGLGSLIFEPSGDFVQVFAATTNNTFGTQTFGITSGTSNCDTSEGSARSVETFIATNRSTLAVEAARGRGETITSLSAIAACSDDQMLGRMLQSNFKSIFTTATVSDQEVSRNMVTLMRGSADLRCSALG